MYVLVFALCSSIAVAHAEASKGVCDFTDAAVTYKGVVLPGFGKALDFYQVDVQAHSAIDYATKPKPFDLSGHAAIMRFYYSDTQGTGRIAANVAGINEVDKLLHGKEKALHTDAGYTGADKRAAKRGRKWYIAAKRSKVKAITDNKLRELNDELERAKASIRAAVEHPFRVIKRQFGYRKVRYKGLAKNHAQVMTLFALSNLWMARKRLLAATG